MASYAKTLAQLRDLLSRGSKVVNADTNFDIDEAQIKVGKLDYSSLSSYHKRKIKLMGKIDVDVDDDTSEKRVEYVNSSWHWFATYEKKIKVMTIFFNPIATYCKAPVILMNIEESFFQAYVNAPSQGQFYLKYIALKTPNGSPNPSSAVDVVDFDAVMDFVNSSQEINVDGKVMKVPKILLKDFKNTIDKFRDTNNNDKEIQKALDHWLESEVMKKGMLPNKRGKKFLKENTKAKRKNRRKYPIKAAARFTANTANIISTFAPGGRNPVGTSVRTAARSTRAYKTLAPIAKTTMNNAKGAGKWYTAVTQSRTNRSLLNKKIDKWAKIDKNAGEWLKKANNGRSTKLSPFVIRTFKKSFWKRVKPFIKFHMLTPRNKKEDPKAITDIKNLYGKANEFKSYIAPYVSEIQKKQDNIEKFKRKANQTSDYRDHLKHYKQYERNQANVKKRVVSKHIPTSARRFIVGANNALKNKK